jgi:hypothetical protein
MNEHIALVFSFILFAVNFARILYYTIIYHKALYKIIPGLGGVGDVALIHYPS